METERFTFGGPGPRLSRTPKGQHTDVCFCFVKITFFHGALGGNTQHPVFVFVIYVNQTNNNINLNALSAGPAAPGKGGDDTDDENVEGEVPEKEKDK